MLEVPYISWRRGERGPLEVTCAVVLSRKNFAAKSSWTEVKKAYPIPKVTAGYRERVIVGLNGEIKGER